MTTKVSTNRSYSRSLGLASLLTLVVFGADADAAPAKKKSDKPAAERSEPRQGSSSQSAPAQSGPNQSAPASQGSPDSRQAPSQSGPTQSAPSQGPSRSGEMSSPASQGARMQGAQIGAGPARTGQVGGAGSQMDRQPVPGRVSTPSGGVSAGQRERQEGGNTGVSGVGGADRGSLERGSTEVNRPQTGQIQGRDGADSRARTTPDRGGSSGASSPTSGGSTGSSGSSGSGGATSPDRSGGSSHDAHGSSSHDRTPPPGSSRGGSSHTSPSSHGSSRPTGTTRSYTSSSHHTSPSYHSHDRRYGHPSPHHVHTHPQAHRPPPAHTYYRSYYVNYWVHPYYRYQHASTVVVSFGFVVNPWVVTWAPPYRPGWTWSAGYYDGRGYYHPGYWVPVAPAPVYRSVQYVYVPGWWDGSTYVEGFYRPTSRSGWTWVDGYYLSDGGYIPGHWQPRTTAPDGYVWQPGFYDGEQWVEGFYRPEYRKGYTWVNGYFDQDGIYNSGYWMPTQSRPGSVWIPGWFDGNQWVEGYWVSEAEYDNADVQGWEPEAGYDAGWNEPEQPTRSSTKRSTPEDARTLSASDNAAGDVPSAARDEDIPLAVPVEVTEENVQ